MYLPEGDQVTLDLSRAKGTLTAEWMHPTEGTITPGGDVQGGAKRDFAVPFVGPAVLYVRKA